MSEPAALSTARAELRAAGARVAEAPTAESPPPTRQSEAVATVPVGLSPGPEPGAFGRTDCGSRYGGLPDAELLLDDVARSRKRQPVVRTFENRQPTDRGSLGETGKPTEIRSPPPSVFNVLRVGFNGRTCEHNARPTARRPSRKDPRGRGRCDPCSRIRRIGSRGWSSMRVSFVRCASCVCFALCVLRFAFCALLLLPVLAVISYINKTLIGTGKVHVLQGVVTVLRSVARKWMLCANRVLGRIKPKFSTPQHS